MIFAYEDSWKNFYPLSLLRSVSEIRCGAMSFREKIEKLYQMGPGLLVREEIFDLVLESEPELRGRLNEVPEGQNVFIAAGTLLTETLPEAEETLFVTKEERVLGFTTSKLKGITHAGDIQGFLDENQLKKVEIPGKRILYPWEIFATLEAEVARDFRGALAEGELDSHAVVYGDDLRLEEGSFIEAGTVIDCRKGPVTISRNTLLKGPNLIEGPCYVGPDTVVDSARLRAGTVLGPCCRVGGEVEASILHGFANKHHQGFLGHAYLGEWVNLGAQTTNSDLKNNYSAVKVNLHGEAISTGLIKFGCLMGDHTKTAIGTLIPTGAIIGIFANLLGGGLCSKNIPSFSWGEADVYELARLLETAEVVMKRRGQTMSQTLKELISALHQAYVG